MEKRIVKVRFSDDLISQLVTKGYEITGHIECTEGLPEGARLLEVKIADENVQSKIIVIATFSHPSFDVVGDDEPIPVKRITFKRFYDESADES